jgi:6-phosphogluconate dehydrogenase
MPDRTIGIVGLGKMGANLALNALDHGMRVVGHTLGNAPEELRARGFTQATDLAALRDALPAPRMVFLYIPAGPAVDDLLSRLGTLLAPGDIVADGGNSYWGDAIHRHARLAERRVRFVDLGTSGGMDGARHGACFMAGGDADAVGALEPVLRALAVADGFVHAGPPGAGHFTKLVHNGIEFGMLQAIGEGMALLGAYDRPLPVADILRCWRHGSVIRSWLIDLMERGYREKGGLDDVPPFVEDTGEVNWLVADALRMEVPVPVIAGAVNRLFASRDSRRDSDRAVALMRHGFGGHPFGSDAGIARERREGRVGEIVRATPRRA